MRCLARPGVSAYLNSNGIARGIVRVYDDKGVTLDWGHPELLACGRGVRRIATELGNERLCGPDGQPVQLGPPRFKNGYHLFLSHGIVASLEQTTVAPASPF